MRYASYDLETSLSRRAEFAPRIACGVSAEWDGKGEIGPGTIELKREALQRLERLLDGDTTLVNQFFPFDVACALEAVEGITDRHPGKYGSASVGARQIWNALRDGRFIGVDICQMLLDVAKGILEFRENTAEPYSLVNVARWNGIELEDKTSTWRLYYSQLENIAPELWPAPAREYVLSDAHLPLEIFRRQLQKNQEWIDSYGHPVLHEAGQQTWAQVALYLTSAHGVLTSRPRVEALKAKTEAEIASLTTRLQAAGLVRADGSRDTKKAKAMVKAAFERQGKSCPMTEPAKNRKSTKPFVPQISTEEDTMILSGEKILVDYAAYGSAGILMTRVDDLAEGYELPLQVEFTSIRATGRTSARKPRAPHKGVQSQNDGQKSGTRECRIPRPGCAFLWGDWEAAESHTLAQNTKDVVGYTRLGELLNSHVDPHAWFAGIARLGLTGTAKEVADAVLARADKKEQRGWAKPSNFGKPGGMGIKKFRLFSAKQYDVYFTEEEAEHYDRIWFASFPEVKDLHRYVSRLLGRNETCTVRIPRGGFVGGGKRFTAACNFFFQAPCAAGAKAALCHVLYECYADPDSPLWGFRAWNLVHDEICLEGPVDRIHDAGVRLSEIMRREFDRYTPDFPTPVEIIAGDAWSKEAKPVYANASGRCKPSDPGARLQVWSYDEFLAAQAAREAAKAAERKAA